MECTLLRPLLLSPAGKAEALVFVVLTVPPNCHDQPRAGYYGVVSLYNITYKTWARLHGASPSIPPGFASNRCMGVGTKVMLLSGWDSHTWEPTHEVYIYDFVRAREGWRRCTPMSTTQVSFAFAAVGGIVYIAGGEDPSSKEGLRLDEACDVEIDTWRQLQDMQYVWRQSLGYSIDGRVVVVRREESGKMFDPCRWVWYFQGHAIRFMTAGGRRGGSGAH